MGGPVRFETMIVRSTTNGQLYRIIDVYTGGYHLRTRCERLR